MGSHDTATEKWRMSVDQMKAKMEELKPVEDKLNQDVQRTKDAYYKAIGAWAPVSRELNDLNAAINLTEQNP